MEHSSSENIAGALKLLEDAAKQKKDELRALISDKYTNLRALIVEGETSLLNSLGAAKDHARSRRRLMSKKSASRRPARWPAA